MSSTKKNIAYSLLYRAVTALLPLVSSPYISRVLGPTKIGEYAYLNTIALYFFCFSMLGVNDYGNREIAKHRKSKKELSETFWQIFYIQLSVSFIATLCYFLLIQYLHIEYKIIGYILCIYVASGCVDINWFAYGIEEFKAQSILWSTIKILCLVGIFLFVKGENDLWKYVLLVNASNIIGCILLWPHVLKHTFYVKPNIKKMIENFKPDFVLFLPVISTSLYNYIDKTMLGHWSNTTDIGFYSYAENVIALFVSLVSAVSTVMLPKTTRMIVTRQEKESINLLYLTSEYICAMYIAFTFGILSVSFIFMPWFLGEEYIESAYMLNLLAPSILINGFSNIIRTQFLIPRALDKIYTISILTGLLFNIVTNIIFIPIFGARGACITTVFSHIAVCFVQIIYTKKQISYMKIFTKLIPFLIFGIIMMFIVCLVPFIRNTFITLTVKSFVGIIVYGGLLIIWKKTEIGNYINRKVRKN